MANKRDLLDEARQMPKKSDCLQSSDGLFCKEKHSPSHLHNHGPDDDDEDEDEDDEDYDDDEDDDEDDEDDEDEDDEDEDEDDEDDDNEEEEDRLAKRSEHEHYATHQHPNSKMSRKITKQFCDVHRIHSSSQQHCKVNISAKR